MAEENYQLIVGPLLIGVVINAIVFGITVKQLVSYSSSGFRDNWWILGMLVWMYSIDAFQVCSSVAMLWHYIVVNFAVPSVFTSSAPWEYATLPIFSSIAPVPAQQFMAFRIMRFSGSRLLFIIVSSLSIGQATLACISAAQGLTLNTALSDSVTIVPLTAAWIVVGVACDTTITVLLLYYLLKSRTGFESEKTDSIISRICSTLIKAAVPVTVFCTIDLCLLITMPNNNVHYTFALPVGRLYTCTILSTLNGRKRLRQQLEASPINPQRMDLNLTSWKDRLQHRRAQRRRLRHSETIVTSEGTVDLDSVRDTLRTMKVDEVVVDEIPEFPEFSVFQHVLVSKL